MRYLLATWIKGMEEPVHGSRPESSADHIYPRSGAFDSERFSSGSEKRTRFGTKRELGTNDSDVV